MNHHLPAGQPLPGGGGGMGPGGRGPVDLGPGPGQHTGNGPRRRPQYPHQQHSYNHHNHNQPIYYQNSHMNPYANAYYPQVQPHYPTAGMPGSPYGMSYNPYTVRSPPAVPQQYAPVVSSSMAHTPIAYSRPPQQQPSPAISTPPAPAPPSHHMTHPPPAPVPHTPSSSHSSQAVQAPLTPTTPQVQQSPAPVESQSTESEAPEAVTAQSHIFKLPWYSHPDSPFPTRSAKSSRRRRRIMTTTTGGVELPSKQEPLAEDVTESSTYKQGDTVPPVEDITRPSVVGSIGTETHAQTPDPISEPATASVERPETPSTQDLPSESAQSTSPTTPASVHTTQAPIAAGVTPTKPSKSTSKAAVPAVPVIPVLPKHSPKDARAIASSEKPASEQKQEPEVVVKNASDSQDRTTTAEVGEDKSEPVPAPVRVAPKSWASLLSTAAASAPARHAVTSSAVDGTNNITNGSTGDAPPVPGFAKSNVSSQAEALHNFRVNNGS